MKENYKKCRILYNRKIQEGIYEIKLEGNFKGQPGQFYMIRGWEGNDPLLARPISILDIEEDGISFLYEVRGKGTHIVSKLGIGDELSILGPLGNGFKDYEGKKLALVSGGVGIAPMKYMAKKLGMKADLYCGFRDRAYYIDQMKDLVDNIHIATETGLEGHKGYIVDLVKDDYDLILACGPIPMFKALKEKFGDELNLQISMESRMACGIGVCLGCVVNTLDGKKRVCKEGPVFYSKEVVL